MQALYRWVLAERYLLLRRLYEKQLKHRLFAKLVRSWRHLDSRNSWNCRSIEEARNRQSLHVKLQRWSSQLEIRRQQEHLANEYCLPRVLQESWTLWRARCLHVLKLEEGAKDIVFYLRTTRALGQWQAAVDESRKQRRRNAYAQTRRLVKKNLAQKVIDRWRNLAFHISALQQTAVDKNQQRLFALATAKFDQWHDGTTSLLDQDHEVATQYLDGLRRDSLRIWLSRHHSFQQASVQASEYHYFHTSQAAYESLRALRTKVLEIRSRNEKASSFQQWNEQRRFRNLLRVWREGTARKRGQPSPVDLLRTARSRRFVMAGPVIVEKAAVAAAAVVGEAATVVHHKDDDWSAFNDINNEVFDLDHYKTSTLLQESQRQTNANANANPTSTTPSKRAARARALVRIPMTPTTPAPLATKAITPFRQRLRILRPDPRHSRPMDLAPRLENHAFEDVPDAE